MAGPFAMAGSITRVPRAAANALLAGVAARLRRSRRLDVLESTWVSSGALVED